MERHHGGHEFQLLADCMTGIGQDKILSWRTVLPGAHPQLARIADLVDSHDARPKRPERVRLGQPEVATELLVTACHHVDHARVAKDRALPPGSWDVLGRPTNDEAECGLRHELPASVD